MQLWKIYLSSLAHSWKLALLTYGWKPLLVSLFCSLFIAVCIWLDDEVTGRKNTPAPSPPQTKTKNTNNNEVSIVSTILKHTHKTQSLFTPCFYNDIFLRFFVWMNKINLMVLSTTQVTLVLLIWFDFKAIRRKWSALSVKAFQLSLIELWRQSRKAFTDNAFRFRLKGVFRSE